MARAQDVEPVTLLVSLREIVSKMGHLRDDEVFRWFQDSAPRWDGGIDFLETYCLTMGQVRRELCAIAALEGVDP